MFLARTNFSQFDMIDSRCHFGVHVVQRAKTNSTLMNAILALSARQLSRTSDFDPYVADAYYQRCFETLIPALNDSIAIRDEPLLAATIILRLMEEMNISIIGSDPQGHLFGTQAIIRAAEQSYVGTTGPNFRQAIYWAAFRQELWISLMTQRAFQLHIFPADRSMGPADDSIWATRTIAHLGDDPFFWRQDRDGSGRNFPDIRFHDKTHGTIDPLKPLFVTHFATVMGNQYNTLAHMLLVVHDPTIPQLGPSHKQSRAVVDLVIVSMNVKIKSDFVICGMSASDRMAFLQPLRFGSSRSLGDGLKVEYRSVEGN
ncbi:hypothetical protein N0V90_010972 [Kalmusia sp. IMI 367209]|nr:hypothetical protein N0V90_010972 [Kalmusia sp. IMI 367209]